MGEDVLLDLRVRKAHYELVNDHGLRVADGGVATILGALDGVSQFS